MKLQLRETSLVHTLTTKGNLMRSKIERSPAPVLLGLFFTLQFAFCANATAPTSVDLLSQDQRAAEAQSDIYSDDFRRQRHAFDVITDPLRLNKGYGKIDGSKAAGSTKRAVTELLRAMMPPSKYGAPSGESTEAPFRELSENDTSAEDGEDLSEYFAALIQAVGELHDPGSIPLLYLPYVLDTGQMATRALAFFGHSEAAKVVHLYQNTSGGVYRVALGMTILNMLEQNTIDDPAVLGKIRDVFFAESFSPHPADRLFAARVLSYYRDTQVQARLAKLARDDPYSLVHKLDQKREFTIRDAATSALRGPFGGGESY